MPLTRLNTRAIPDSAITSTKIANGAVTASSIGTTQLAAANLPAGSVLQVQQAFFNQSAFSGVGYHTLATINITPYYTNSIIMLQAAIPFGIVLSHACQGRFLRNGNTFNTPSDSNRAGGHSGSEGSNSDGGGFFGIIQFDTSHNTTSQISYQLQIGFENPGTNRVGTSSINYGDGSGYGYPGTYQSRLFAMEIKQ